MPRPYRLPTVRTCPKVGIVNLTRKPYTSVQ